MLSFDIHVKRFVKKKVFRHLEVSAILGLEWRHIAYRKNRQGKGHPPFCGVAILGLKQYYRHPTLYCHRTYKCSKFQSTSSVDQLLFLVAKSRCANLGCRFPTKDVKNPKTRKR